ncbi:DUF927 domain-containing protein [Jannaschia sp. M317]|uniref:DUF927 domain-containing protein n=1 Tax=Jannaschia sp. M317 TaxID=2867011 RepID=UPI0021A48604|nr:DUF927 domain-containing protein [Jannaschia sp. M317]UWQ17074.1 DUF927 domain-containing protein [Jannaschia sp. M317]
MKEFPPRTQENYIPDASQLKAAQESRDAFWRLRTRNSPYKTPEAKAFYKRFQERIPQENIEKAVATLAGRADGHNVATLAAAYAYADAGLHVVDAHALKHNGKGTGPGGQVKIPRGTGWQMRATRDTDEISRAWLGKGHYLPDKEDNVYRFASINAPRNVSAAFPPDCGLIVFDLDGPEGLAAWQALQREHGPVPKTWASRTGSGGYHFIFRATGVDIRNTASAIAPGVDVRGKNGQIVVSPSFHPNGRPYDWREGRAPWECEVADAPEWLVKRAQDATKVGKAKDAEVEKEVRAKRSSKGTGDRVSGLGFEGYLATIGDGDDSRGFDSPIYSAMLSYFATGGDDDDALTETVRDAVLAAPCKDKRNVTRYAQDDYLVNRVAQAREFIAGQTPEVDLDRFEDPQEWMAFGYKIKRDTIYKEGGKDVPDIAVCQRIEVVGRSSNLDGTAGTGRIIQFENENGETVELTLARSELYKDGGGDTIARLSDAGMQLFIGGKKSRDDLLNLLRQITPQRRIPTLPTPGWTRDRMGLITGFMLPTGKYICAVEGQVTRLHDLASFKDKHAAGTLEGSKMAANAALQSPNFYWTFGICAGFVGPIQTLAGLPSCGFNLSGDSSLGKTLAEVIAAMVWGNPHTGKGGFHGMNTTTNAIEDLAVRSSGTVLCLDEIGQMKSVQDLSSILFGLGAGAGKSRKSGAGLGLVETAEYQVFAILSNEHSLRNTVEGAGGKYKTGLSVRFPDVDVTGGVKVSGEVLAQLEHAKTNFGHMGPLFVQYLIDDGWINRPEELKRKVAGVVDELAGDDAPATKRAAQVFALACVAGELAADAGLISDKAAVKAAVSEAFTRFKGSAEGQVTKGPEAMLDGLRSYIARNMRRTIVPASDASDPGYRDIVGWYTDDQIILDKNAVSDVAVLGLRGTLPAMLDALAGVGALQKSGKTRYHNMLPAEVELEGTGDKHVRNYRISRAALGI